MQSYNIQFILEKAKEISTRSHANQYRKGSNVPYIEHPKDVVRRVGENWELSVVAWLHDVLEDSNETENSLIQDGIPDYLVEQVVLLTHARQDTYSEYIDKISTSKIATQVKIADILSNLSDLPSIKQIRRYSDALLKLTKVYIENNNIQSSKKSVHEINEIVEDVKDGLLSHSQDPIGWLTSFIDNFDNDDLKEIIADKDQIPENLRKLNRPPTALIVDCGTGETKLLLYTYSNDKINFKEILKLNAVTSYIDKSEDFINTIRFFLTKHNADIVLIAASAWLREASLETVYKGNSLLTQLLDSGMLCKVLDSREEAWMELVAAEYISNKLGLKISGTYSSGAGSTQFTKSFSEVYSFKIGNEIGRNLILKNGIRGVGLWENEIQRVLIENSTQINGLTLCMSAVCHAANECGLLLNTELTHNEVTSKFKFYINQQFVKENLSPLDIRNLSNVIQHLYTINSIISESSNLIFIRDIEISNQNLRVTWSLGWYLELLNRLNYLNYKNKAINKFRKEQFKFSEIGQKVENDLKVSKVSRIATGHVLLDIEQTADIILNKANTIENVLTSKLQLYASNSQARLEGLEYRLKSRESLIRKLNTRLKKLISTNTSLQLYIPRLIDIFNEVDDVLRYTVIADTHNYTLTTTSILEKIKTEFDCEYKCFSFWKRDSSYLGINVFVTISNFTFEIQFHTNESWKVKQSESHDLYEGYRSLHNSYAKFIIYTNMKKIWDSVPIPPDVHKIVEPISLIDTILEEYGTIRKICELIHNYNSANSNKLIEFIKSSEVKNNICIRLLRGKNEEEFKYLSYPPLEKRLAWVSSTESLLKLLNSDSSEFSKSISDTTGKPLSWVENKIKQGYKWKVVILPKQNCTLADWNGVFKLIQEYYPKVASIVLRFKKQLLDLDFNEIEQEIYPPNTFRNIKDNKSNNQQYFDENNLIELESPLLWQVRGFLYNVIGLNENFKGDGYIYNDSSKKMHAEYLTQNKEITEIFGAKVIELANLNNYKSND